MEGELWQGLQRARRRVALVHHEPPNNHFTDARIVEVLLWACLHDRPISWACQATHWPPHRRTQELPSPATMSRRLRTLSVLFFLAAIEALLRAEHPQCLVKSVDAMPLPVGSWSKDRNARRGRAGNTFAKGYKLFAIVNGPVIDAWAIGPMNESESGKAQTLLPRVGAGAYLLGDALYDSNPLHAVAAALGWQLVAPRKKPGTGLGQRRHQSSRLRSIELLEGPGRFGRELYLQRITVERDFAHVGCFPCGLGPLPRWVRTPFRVALWVQAKLIIYGVRLQQRKSAA
jgi:hypothetical protein